MTLQPASLPSRALALAILAGLAAAFYLLVAAPMLDDYAESLDSIAQRSLELERYRRAAAELPRRQAELAALRERRGTVAGFLAGGNDAVVAAQLQNRIRGLVEQARGELKSTQVLPGEDEGAVRRIAVRGQLTGTLGAVQRVLYALESGSPLLFVDNLSIHADLAEESYRGQGLDPTLDVTLDVYGYLPKPRPDAATARPPQQLQQ
jgi:general secretion pathway protein M